MPPTRKMRAKRRNCFKPSGISENRSGGSRTMVELSLRRIRRKIDGNFNSMRTSVHRIDRGKGIDEERRWDHIFMHLRHPIKSRNRSMTTSAQKSFYITKSHTLSLIPAANRKIFTNQFKMLRSHRSPHRRLSLGERKRVCAISVDDAIFLQVYRIQA